MRLGEARIPDGLRVYAIGDVHGRDDLLREAHEKVEADLAARPIADHRLIHLGDYVDRGPNSAAVIARLVRAMEDDTRVLCLKGNHEELLLEFLDHPVDGGPTFLSNGGLATLTSYGLPPDSHFFSNRDMIEAADRLAAAMPAKHRALLDSLGLSAAFGDFFFCHAGVRPGVALDRQAVHDLTWIRGPFLNSDADFGKVVIHGHTPVDRPEIKANRIDIDTGAVFSGVLTTIALEGTDYRFL